VDRKNHLHRERTIRLAFAFGAVTGWNRRLIVILATGSQMRVPECCLHLDGYSGRLPSAYRAIGNDQTLLAGSVTFRSLALDDVWDTIEC
jgi:hypothetical protein